VNYNFVSTYSHEATGPDGGPRQPTDRFFSFHDGDHFRGSKGEYFSGYRDQVQFIVDRLQVIVGSLLSRPGTKPVMSCTETMVRGRC
jgi:hypothetical protein